LVAGTGTYEPYLRQLAGGSDAVHFVGYQTGSALDLLYGQAVALIVPSVNYEVSPPLVIMEAFRQRTPAIVRRLGSMPEIIEDSGGGLVYGTDSELLASLDALLERPAYRDTLGRQAQRAMLEQRTPEAYLAKYLDLIDELRRRSR
jgi:glycosyltransferase involved in cell wall biosynthesis